MNNETTNTPVDVLAVLDELIAVPVIECLEDQEFVDNAKKARAAIAELIEAVKAVKQWNDVSGLDDEWPLVMEVVDAALTRVGGVK